MQWKMGKFSRKIARFLVQSALIFNGKMHMRAKIVAEQIKSTQVLEMQVSREHAAQQACSRDQSTCFILRR